MRRRSAVVGAVAASALLLWRSSGAASSASASGARARVVHVSDYPSPLAQEERGELLQAFERLGYGQGRNLELTTYDGEMLRAGSTRGSTQSFPDEQFGPNPYTPFFATRIARTQPRLILASGVRVVSAARESGLTTPLVFFRITDPVGLGFVASLARPGGNMTGFSRAIEKLTVKRLELLHDMVPAAQRVAFIFVEDFPSHVRQAAEVRAVAARVGLQLREYAVQLSRWDEAGLEAIFATMRRDGIEAFLLPDLNVLGPVLVELAARYRLPTIHSLSHVVTDWGGLAAYSTEATRIEDVVGYAVRILRGERTVDLPVQEPTRFELILNARAARDLGLTFPPSFLLRASQVVEK